MYYVYMLKNESSKEIYYGYTRDLDRRIEEHKKNGNYKLIYYEAFLSEQDARDREISLKKYGQSRSHLKNRLKESLQL